MSKCKVKVNKVRNSIFSIDFINTVQSLVGMKKKIFLDLSFNRMACWTEDQMKQFIICLVLGGATQKIHVADVNTCIDYCISIGKHKDAEYFKEVRDKENCKFIALDGNNRTVTFYNFITTAKDSDANPVRGSEFIVTKEDLETQLNIKVWDHEAARGSEEEESKLVLLNEFKAHFIPKDPKKHKVGAKYTFNDLSVEMQEAIEQSKQCLEVYKIATREDLSIQFQRLNDGQPQTDQLKRNSKMVIFASKVRQLLGEAVTSSDYDNQKKYSRKINGKTERLSAISVHLLKEGYKNKDVATRKLDEDTLKRILQTVYGDVNVTKTLMDTMYVDDSPALQDWNMIQKVFDVYIDMLCRIDINNELDTKSKLDTLYVMINHLMLAKVTLPKENREKIFKILNQVYKDLMTDKTFICTITGGSKAWAFSECGGLTDTNKLKARKQAILNRINEKYPQFWDLVVTKDPQERFKPAQKYEFWFKQGGQLSGCKVLDNGTIEYVEYQDAKDRYGNLIPYDKILDGNFCHGDHIKARYWGGSSETYNGELILKRTNLRKGKKSVEDFMKQENRRTKALAA